MGFGELLLSETPILDKWGGILDLHKIFNASQRTLTSDTCRTWAQCSGASLHEPTCGSWISCSLGPCHGVWWRLATLRLIFKWESPKTGETQEHVASWEYDRLKSGSPHAIRPHRGRGSSRGLGPWHLGIRHSLYWVYIIHVTPISLYVYIRLY